MEWDFDLETPDETVLDGSPGGLIPLPVYDALLENHGSGFDRLVEPWMTVWPHAVCVHLVLTFSVLLKSNPCVNVNLGEA